MADETVTKTDANSQTASSASSTEGAQGQVVETSASESTGTTGASEKVIPYERFSEVVGHKNEAVKRA